MIDVGLDMPFLGQRWRLYTIQMALGVEEVSPVSDHSDSQINSLLKAQEGLMPFLFDRKSLNFITPGYLTGLTNVLSLPPGA